MLSQLFLLGTGGKLLKLITLGWPGLSAKGTLGLQQKTLENSDTCPQREDNAPVMGFLSCRVGCVPYIRA